ncbi:MAG: qseC [Gammaproteobacteria bacterium]|jgi:two-component system sensor histidine kinase QseC|nr:qseC [Gammaproteobacteria bacterium]
MSLYQNRQHISSLRRFLLLSSLSSLLFAIIALIAINYLQLSMQNQRVLQTELINAARVLDIATDIKAPKHSIAYALLNQEHQAEPTTFPGINIYNKHLNYRDKMVFQVWSLSNNQLIMKSTNAPTEVLSDQNIGFSSITLTDGSQWYSFSLPNLNKNIKTVVAVPKKFVSAVDMPLFLESCIFFGLVFIALALLLTLVIQIGLNPLSRLTKEISERGPSHLSALNTREIPVEIEPLVRSLNRLFQQLSETLAREKQFTADAAHELRTPLAAVKTQVEVALREKDENQRDRILNNIVIGTNRITHIVDQLLTLSRLESTVKLPYPTKLDLNKLTSSIVAELALSAISKQIEIELFAPDTEMLITGDQMLIGILLRNLIDNAIRYTPAHGKVLVILSQTADSICLQVVDNGQGLPEELHYRLFDRFFRQIGTQVEGSGLGLPITREIVRLHHANIQAKKPEQGCGLEMRVDFPIEY